MTPITSAIVVGIGMVILIAVGLWVINGMTEDDEPVERPSFKEWTDDYVRDNAHKLKPPPEPEH
jgi:hypothetical protein